MLNTVVKNVRRKLIQKKIITQTRETLNLKERGMKILKDGLRTIGTILTIFVEKETEYIKNKKDLDSRKPVFV